MARKGVKITKITEESRRDTFQRAVKHGSMQNTIDKVLDKAGSPVAEKANEMLAKLHPGADIAAPVVDSFVKSSILAGLAEVLGSAHLVGSKIPGLNKVDEEKYTALSAYLRSYAGQRAGTQTADASFKLAPLVMGMLSNPAIKEVLDGVSSMPTLPAAGNTKSVDFEGAVKKLSEDDD